MFPELSVLNNKYIWTRILLRHNMGLFILCNKQFFPHAQDIRAFDTAVMNHLNREQCTFFVRMSLTEQHPVFVFYCTIGYT